MYNTSREVFCPMAKVTIKCGQCVQIHFELMGAFDPEMLMTLVKSYRLQFEEIEGYCNECEFQPFKKAKEQEEAFNNQEKPPGSV
jgi:hypothetical protein